MYYISLSNYFQEWLKKDFGVDFSIVNWLIDYFLSITANRYHQHY
jgi:hypothetical protein